jgi:hypothetical protein
LDSRLRLVRRCMHVSRSLLLIAALGHRMTVDDELRRVDAGTRLDATLSRT